MIKDNSDIVIGHYDPERLGEIINLMKSSLGESLMPKSENFFRWKHEENFFGRSKIIVATCQNRIVGLRTFMHWKWANAEEEVAAVRAVDTATDPAFQGKGIFRMLTLQAVEECRSEGVDLVFNTPNPISKQGYLKMGWVESGRMPLIFGTGYVFPKKFDRSFESDCMQQFSIKEAIEQYQIDQVLPLDKRNFSTPLSPGYFSWRFADCPTIQYGMMADGDNFGFIFRLKPIKGFIELRICEYWQKDNPEAFQAAAAALRHIRKKIRPLFISCAPISIHFKQKNQLPGYWKFFEKGPFVTLRSLARQDLQSFMDFSEWKPSIGSMELF